MTTFQLEIPTDLEESLREQGWWNQEDMRKALREALRLQAIAFFKDLADKVESLGTPPMSEEEIQAEIDAMHAEEGW